MENIQITALEQMKSVDVRTVDQNSLVDIKDIHIDEKLPRKQRFSEFLRQIGNPYCYRCGKVVVKVSFANTNATLEDRLEHYLKTI